MNESTAKQRRRFFRFRLRTFPLLPMLVAAGWWWLSWPERTARRFVQLLEEGDLESAKAMIDDPQPSDGFWKIATSGKFRFDPPAFQPANRRDYLAARRTFHFD